MSIQQYQEQGQSLLKAKNWAALQALGLQCREAYPEAPLGYYLEAHGHEADEEGNKELAAWGYSRAAELQPEELKYILGYARIKEQEDPDEAAGYYSQVLQIEPKNSEALHAMALYYLRHKQEPEYALGYFQNLEALFYEQPLIHIHYAEALYSLGQTEEAKDIVGYAMHEAIYEEGAVLMLRILNEEQEPPYRDMLEYYQFLIKQRPYALAYQYQYARCLYHLEQFEEAHTAFALAKGLHEQENIDADAEFYRHWASNAEAQEDYALALQLLNWAIEARAEGEELRPYYEQRAAVYAALGKFDEALADASKAVQEASYNEFIQSKSQAQRAIIHIQAGNIEEALKDYEQVEKVGLFLNELSYIQGHLAYSKKDWQKAHRSWLLTQELGDTRGKEQIRKKLAHHLKEKQAELYEEFSPEWPRHAQHPLIAELKGKFWVFATIKDEFIGDWDKLPEEQKEVYGNYLQRFAVLFSDKYVFFAQPRQEEERRQLQYRPGIYFYSIEKEGKNGLLLKMQGRDGLDAFQLKLQLLDKGKLLWACNSQRSYTLHAKALEELQHQSEEEFAKRFAHTDYQGLELDEQSEELLYLVL